MSGRVDGASPTPFDGPVSVVLSGPAGDRPVPVDLPFVPEAEAFFDDLLDRMDRPAGLPRLLFVSDGGSGRDAGLAAVALARRAASRGMDVLLVDASFPSPALGKPFPYQPEEGLADVVLWGASLQAAIHKTRDERIRVVNIGSPPPEPEKFWDSEEAEEALRAMRAEAALTILVGPIRDGEGGESPLLAKCDRALLVRKGAADAPARPESPDTAKVIEIVLEEEGTDAGAASEAISSPPEAEDRAEGTRIPVWRTIGIFAVVCVVIGFVLSYFYLNRRGDAERGEGVVAERSAEVAPARDETERRALPEAAEGTGGETDGTEETPVAGAEEETPGEAEGADEGVPAGGGEEDAVESEAVSAAPVPEERPAQTPGERAAAPPPAAPPPAERGAEGPVFGVHVESFPTREDAERASVRFLDGGETVEIVEKPIPGKGTWYRIVLGRFAGSREARAHAEEAKARFGLDYVLVVRLDG
ncbi:MAG: SPOR domain-containing protein [Candidatus Eisenbacteria bacterium]|nr:SPOR domain-containing protein [Candidatus Eisenbacteria bacterium]